MSTWQAVAPILPVSVIPNHILSVGPGVELARTPEWFVGEQSAIRREVGERQTLLSAAALICTFEASGFGAPEASPPGPKARTRQEVAIGHLHAAMLSLWLARPTALHMEAAACVDLGAGGSGPVQFSSPWRLQPHLPRKAYLDAHLLIEDVDDAHALATVIQTLPYPSALWTALRCLAVALDGRDLGASSPDALGRDRGAPGSRRRKRDPQDRLERAARLLNPSNDNAGREAYALVWESYEWRCAASHGARLPVRTEEQGEAVLLHAESILRSILRRILQDAFLHPIFTSDQRDAYLKTTATGFHPPP